MGRTTPITDPGTQQSIEVGSFDKLAHADSNRVLEFGLLAVWYYGKTFGRTVIGHDPQIAIRRSQLLN